jgi:PTH1 family peptidyl-tRNA hydrolase
LNAARKLLKRSKGSSVPPKLVIVGLGNPGEEYAGSRHNVGFWCVDRIAGEHSIPLSRRNRSTLLGEGVIEGHPVALAKPRTFVNRSGEAITYLLARFRVSPGELLVIYDDIALPLGKIRLRPEGSAGGHNGIKSITQAIGTQDFPRLRVGVGAPPPGSDQIGYVLGSIPDDEMEVANAAVDRVAQAVASVLTEGIDTTMNRFN